MLKNKIIEIIKITTIDAIGIIYFKYFFVTCIPPFIIFLDAYIVAHKDYNINPFELKAPDGYQFP